MKNHGNVPIVFKDSNMTPNFEDTNTKQVTRTLIELSGGMLDTSARKINSFFVLFVDRSFQTVGRD